MELISEPQQIPLTDGELLYIPELFDRDKADSLFAQLENEIPWRQDQIKLFGRDCLIPRLQHFQGDSGISYTYSGLKMPAADWHPAVTEIRDRISQHYDAQFNCVLLNLYRNGQDSMGWHSDDEKELGENPVIASVTLGEARRFLLRHRYNKQLPKCELQLQHGSLLVMSGKTQHYWQHSVPRTARAIEPRINLTFRRIVT